MDKEQDWEKILKFLKFSSVILCLYGVFNWITRSNPYDSFITSVYETKSFSESYLNLSEQGYRFRISSFIAHPIAYGYVASILFLCIFSTLHKLKRKFFSISVLFLLVINIFMTNSRTPLLSCIIGFLIYVLMVYNLKSKLKIFFITLIIGAFSYSTIPFFSEKIDNIVDIFATGGVNADGSSLDMRVVQFGASYMEFSRSSILGNGFYYIEENLGWSNTNEERTSESEFAGFESYVFNLLIEAGLIQIVIVIIFYLVLFRYFYKARIHSKEYAGLGISITSMFLFFIITTGVLGTWIITMTILGILIKLIKINRKKIDYAIRE